MRLHKPSNEIKIIFEKSRELTSVTSSLTTGNILEDVPEDVHTWISVIGEVTAEWSAGFYHDGKESETATIIDPQANWGFRVNFREGSVPQDVVIRVILLIPGQEVQTFEAEPGRACNSWGVLELSQGKVEIIDEYY